MKEDYVTRTMQYLLFLRMVNTSDPIRSVTHTTTNTTLDTALDTGADTVSVDVDTVSVDVDTVSCRYC